MRRFLLALALLAASSAHAVTVVTGAIRPDVVTGFHEIDVGGELFNVDFVGGICDRALVPPFIARCNGVLPIFDASSVGAAANALARAIATYGFSGMSLPGCLYSPPFDYCSTLETPYWSGAVGDTTRMGSWLSSFSLLHPELIGPAGDFGEIRSGVSETTQHSIARWSRVPEPASIALVLLATGAVLRSRAISSRAS